MKKVTSLIILLWLGNPIRLLSQNETQQITAVQYFYDSDPGQNVTGNGGILPLTLSSSISQTFSLSTPSLTDGPHTFYMRFKDEYGRWSIAERQLFYIHTPTTIQNISSIQYYYDSDPGVGVAGNGAIIPVAPVASLSQGLSFTVPGNLSDGLHQLYIRTMNEEGVWSTSERKSFYIEHSVSSESITAIQYYFDSDPGVGVAGNGAIIPVAPVASLSQGLSFTVPGNLSDGLHQLYIRTMNEEGVWSTSERRSFYIEHSVSSESITAVQYYFDSDPGWGVQGNGIVIDYNAENPLVRDTNITIPPGLGCNPNFCIRFRDNLGRWSIAEHDTFENPLITPWSDFSVTRTDNHFYFNSEFANTTQFSWNFDDGSPLEPVVVNPMHTYSIPDEYDVCLSIANSTCGTRMKCHNASLPGVASMIPNRSAPTNLLIAEISGGGYGPTTTFRFVGSSMPVIIPDTTIISSAAQARIRCKLNNVPPGYRDLIVTIPGEPDDTLKDALYIVPPEDVIHCVGVPPVVTISGPPVIRTNRTGYYTITYTNHTDETMIGVITIITLNGYAHIRTRQPKFDSTDYYINILIDDLFVPDTNETTNEPDRQSGTFEIPSLPPGASYNFGFDFGSGVGGSSPIHVETEPPLYDPSGNTLPGGGGPSCDNLPPCLQCALDNLPDVPIAQCFSSGFDVGCDILDLLDKPTVKEFKNIGKDIMEVLENCAGVEVNGKIKNLFKVLDAITGKDDEDGSEDTGGLLSPECVDCIGNATDGGPFFANSGDPNIKVGSGTNDVNHFVNGATPFNYQVHFENLDTATAPAQFVYIDDYIDTSKFDLSTFEFVSFGFGDTIVKAGVYGDEFGADIDLRPAQNIIARTVGNFNPVNGQLTWNFYSLTTDSLRPVTDPLAGFLPPNVSPPEGEGFIEFRLQPKASLPHNDVVLNNASIVFDDNPAMITNAWNITIDKEKPESHVMMLPSITHDSVITLVMVLSDPGSGVADYQLYVSENDGPFAASKWHMEDTIRFYGQHNAKYEFYTVARDRVMNQEDIPIDTGNSPDAVTLLDTTTTVFYADSDGDGFGNVLDKKRAYIMPTDYVSDATDCDDSKSEVHPGALEVCNLYDDNCDGLIDQLCSNTLQLKVFIEGFYIGNQTLAAVVDPTNQPGICDSVVVELHEVFAPYNMVYSIQGIINTQGESDFVFPPEILNHSYYIVVRHRNSINIWSKYPVLFDEHTKVFDLTH